MVTQWTHSKMASGHRILEHLCRACWGDEEKGWGIWPSCQSRPDLGGSGQSSWGGAEFREGGRSRGGAGAAKQGGMGVTSRSPAPSRLDNAPKPPDRRAPDPL
ncbi:hypothetical protein J1605_020126 [Eschrichtius robustus]|uniref:Uncharacterized protein n=1 Tax=Eschrichtius robustus TaxID=9764 RepID=A0AB34HLR5_ESCRO|nr:hypothetical protein J1605_020126 [Eschrichtius robustus]